MARRGMLVVAGTGIQWGGQTTLAARCAIEQAEKVLFAVADPGSAQWVLKLNPGAESLPYPRDEKRRRNIYQQMVERIMTEVRKDLHVCAVFYGHPAVFADPAHLAIRRARDEGFEARMLPGVSFMDCLFADLGLDPGRDGCQVFEATDFLIRRRMFDVYSPIVLCQIGVIGNTAAFDGANRQRIQHGLAVLADVLGQRFQSQHEVVIYEASTHPLRAPRMDRVPLCELQFATVSEISTLVVPPLSHAASDLEMKVRLGMVNENWVLKKVTFH